MKVTTKSVEVPRTIPQRAKKAQNVNVRPKSDHKKDNAIDRAKSVEKFCLRKCGRNAKGWSEVISHMVWTA